MSKWDELMNLADQYLSTRGVGYCHHDSTIIESSLVVPGLGVVRVDWTDLSDRTQIFIERVRLGADRLLDASPIRGDEHELVTNGSDEDLVLVRRALERSLILDRLAEASKATLPLSELDQES